MQVMRSRRGNMSVVVVVLLLAAGALAACGGGDGSVEVSEASGDGPANFDYVIPPGAGEAIDRGEPLEILPERLQAEVGDDIRIVNHDQRGHLIGPFFVGAGETVRQEFSSAGEFTGECTVHPSGQITIAISA